MYTLGIAPALTINVSFSSYSSLKITKIGRNVTFLNKNGPVFSKNYCPVHYYMYFKTQWLSMLFHISLLLHVQFREQTFSQIEKKLNSSFYVRYVDNFLTVFKNHCHVYHFINRIAIVQF